MSEEDRSDQEPPMADDVRTARKASIMKSLAEGLAESLEATQGEAEARTSISRQSLVQSLAASLEAEEESKLGTLMEKEEPDDDRIGDLPEGLMSRRGVSEASDSGGLWNPNGEASEATRAITTGSLPLQTLRRRNTASSEDMGSPRSWAVRSEPLGSRSGSKDSVVSRDTSRTLTKDGTMASILQASSANRGVSRLDREELKRLGQQLNDMQETCQERFVQKMDFFSLLSRMARMEESMEQQLGRAGSVTSTLNELSRESRVRMAEQQKLHRQMDEISRATVGNTSRIRADAHRVENAADHAYKTAKHLEEVSSDFSVTKEVLRDDISRMAKAVQVLANEFSIFEEENEKSQRRKAEQISHAGAAIEELQKQLGKQEIHGTSMEDGLELMKHEVETCAKQESLKKLERSMMDMQEENARLQEIVHEKIFQIQDQERKEMLAAFAAKWDPYNRTRLLRKCADAWVEFLRRQNKAREALARVKHVYAKTHVTARLRSWWYLMQRDHTDGQFKRLSENLETQEAKLEGARGAMLRHEKATSEQARNLQYRLLAVEKGLEAAEKEKAAKVDVEQSFMEVDRRLNEELALNPIREDIAEIKALIGKLQEEKTDIVDAEAEREKVHGFCQEFRAWLWRHDESLARKAEITENDTKADAKTIEQVLVLLAKQADQLATMVAQDFDQLRQALTRFLEISPDFRKASLAIGFEPLEECVACRALPRKCAAEPAIGADGLVYKQTVETAMNTVEETQRVLAEKLRYPLTLSSNSFVGCTSPPSRTPDPAQPLPLLRQMVLAESGWLTGKESLPDRICRKLGPDPAPLQEVPLVPTRSRQRPPSAQEDRPERPHSVRSYFPAINQGRVAGK